MTATYVCPDIVRANIDTHACQSQTRTAIRLKRREFYDGIPASHDECLSAPSSGLQAKQSVLCNATVSSTWQIYGCAAPTQHIISELTNRVGNTVDPHTTHASGRTTCFWTYSFHNSQPLTDTVGHRQELKFLHKYSVSETNVFCDQRLYTI